MEGEVKKINCISDNRGNLLPIEFGDLPFIPKRIFVVNNVPKGSVRGNHSHFETVQILICISGEIEVTLHDGFTEKKNIIYEGEYILVKNLVWDSQKFLSDNSVLLVICSTEYNVEDYIFNFNDFLKIKTQ
jgi:dTDP-4-dehydrorhamnose 3,5-epimerase-like enzyme